MISPIYTHNIIKQHVACDCVYIYMDICIVPMTTPLIDDVPIMNYCPNSHDFTLKPPIRIGFSWIFQAMPQVAAAQPHLRQLQPGRAGESPAVARGAAADAGAAAKRLGQGNSLELFLVI